MGSRVIDVRILNAVTLSPKRLRLPLPLWPFQEKHFNPLMMSKNAEVIATTYAGERSA